MKCPEFMGRHSEFLDERLGPGPAERMRAHRRECRRCARYDRVVREAVEEFRSLPSMEPSRDFRPRLRHRLFHLRDRESFQPGPASGTTLLAVTLLAVFMAAAAWSPVMRSGPPEVALEPMVVTREEPPADPTLLLEPIDLESVTGVAGRRGKWAVAETSPTPNALLYLYSPLAGRARGSSIFRAVRIDR